MLLWRNNGVDAVNQRRREMHKYSPRIYCMIIDKIVASAERGFAGVSPDRRAECAVIVDGIFNVRC